MDGCDHLAQWLTEGSNHYAITPLDEPKEASVPTTSATVLVSSAKHSEIVYEELTMPVVKKKTLGV